MRWEQVSEGEQSFATCPNKWHGRVCNFDNGLGVSLRGKTSSPKARIGNRHYDGKSAVGFWNTKRRDDHARAVGDILGRQIEYALGCDFL